MLTLNRALDQAFTASALGAGPRLWVPALDVAEKSEAYLVSMELPGVDPSQVEVHFEQHVLTVRGTKPASFDASSGELRVYASERVSGAFERAVRLPDSVDAERIEASFHNGLLTIVIPKAQAAQPRRIRIRAGESTQGARQIEDAQRN